MTQAQASTVSSAIAAEKAAHASKGKTAGKPAPKGAAKPKKAPKPTVVERAEQTAEFTIRCQRSEESIKRTMNRLSDADKKTLEAAIKADRNVQGSLKRQLLAAGAARVVVQTEVIKYSDGFVANLIRPQVVHP